MPESFRMHVFVCTNKREDSHPRGCCSSKQSLEIMTKIKRAARAEGLADVRVNKSGCLDRCEFGPSCVIYPEGTWYSLPSDEEGLDEILLHLKGEGPSRRHEMG